MENVKNCRDLADSILFLVTGGYEDYTETNTAIDNLTSELEALPEGSEILQAFQALVDLVENM